MKHRLKVDVRAGRPTVTVAVLTATVALLLAGCLAAEPDPSASTGEDPSSPAQETLPTKRPPLDSGTLGGGGDSGDHGGGNGNGDGGGDGNGDGGGGNGGGNGGGDGDGDGDNNGGGGHNGGGGGGGGDGGDGGDSRTIEVGGPTLGADYPEYFGNIYPGDIDPGQTWKCAGFRNGLSYGMSVESVTATQPLVPVRPCRPDDPELEEGPGCTGGLVLPASGGWCTFGVTFVAGTHLDRNYTPTYTWSVSVKCTDTVSEPCSLPAVASLHPTTTDPVVARWTWTEPMRYCGATAYADDQGSPDGGGWPPEYGCTADVPPDDGEGG